MVGSYSKHPYCYTCDKRVDGFLAQHTALGHKLTEIYFGGYAPVEEKREPLKSEPKEEKLNIELMEVYEEEPEDMGEIGG